MSKTIWKYELAVVSEQFIDIPQDSEFLCVQIQHDIPCLWVKVNEDIETVPIKIFTVGTGHSAQPTEGMQYVGTYQLYNGDFVGHVFIDNRKV